LAVDINAVELPISPVKSADGSNVAADAVAQHLNPMIPVSATMMQPALSSATPCILLGDVTKYYLLFLCRQQVDQMERGEGSNFREGGVNQKDATFGAAHHAAGG
jgi:hypothetical protein